MRRDRAGTLYALLFRQVMGRKDHYDKWNTALHMLDGDKLDAQSMATFVLWGLGRVPDGWWPTKQLAFALLPPWTLEEWLEFAGEWFLATMVELSVLHTFRELGLMAERDYPNADDISPELSFPRPSNSLHLLT